MSSMKSFENRFNNPLRETNRLSVQFFEIFGDRCYDGELPWKICDLFLKYKETCKVITTCARVNFEFDDEIPVLPLPHIKSDSIKNLENAMEKCVDVFREFTKTRDITFNLHFSNLTPKLVKAEIKDWNIFQKHLNETSIPTFETALVNWISDVQKLAFDDFPGRLESVCQERQKEVNEIPISFNSLLYYVTYRVGLTRKEIVLSKKTKEWLLKLKQLYTTGKKNRSNDLDDKLNMRLRIMCLNLDSISTTFNTSILEEFLKKYIKFNKSLLTYKEQMNKRLPKLKMASVQIYLVNKKLREECFQYKFDESLIYFIDPNKEYQFVLNISPPSRISFDSKDIRINLRISSNATMYAFVYPLSKDDLLKLKTNEYDWFEDKGIQHLFSTGGYIYLDNNYNIVSMTGMLSMNDIGNTLFRFTGPYQSKISPTVAQSFIFQPTPLGMVDTTNSNIKYENLYFCWVPPKVLTLDDNGLFLFKILNKKKKKFNKFNTNYVFFKLALADNNTGSQRNKQDEARFTDELDFFCDRFE